MKLPAPTSAHRKPGSRHPRASFPQRIAFALAVILCWPVGVLAQGGSSGLLFSFFRDNGQDGLYLAWSRDALKWTEIKPAGKSFLQPKVGGKLMRDPCLALGPDGTFHMIWTTGWGQPPVAGYAHSTNLVDWSEQRALPVMSHEPGARNVWAPELFYDEVRRRWLIFWSTTIPGRFPATDQTGDDSYNHRIYCTTTADFQTFTPTRLLYDGGFNVIDATLLKAGGKCHLIVKDETLKPVRKHLRMAEADTADGPFGPAGPAFSTAWVEGPSAVEWEGRYFVYFDHYAQPQYYGALRSADLAHWENVSKQVSFPSGARHGTALRVPQSVLTNLLDRGR
jgi:hypothetical protein